MVLERPALVGQDHIVPTVTGEHVRYVNLDYAASTPALQSVMEALEALLPWYSSAHRGMGYKSQVSTAAYEGAREAVAAFCHARANDTVIFTRNTTDALNLLASALPEGTQVFNFAGEHHANLLPWRRVSDSVHHLPIPESPEAALVGIEDALQVASTEPKLVTVTGASNVTGELWPLSEITELAHRYDARVLVDAAQLAPHFPIDLCALDADFLAFSGHKMYAPFGAGVLIGRSDWLRDAPPFLYGGGAVDFVTLESVLWAPLPDRQEAGSPNIPGAVALGVACNVLTAYGMEQVAAEEVELGEYAREALATVPEIEVYGLWQDADVTRLGIVAFNLATVSHSQLAAILSAEYGIGVRHGCFCAHPYVQNLLRCSMTRAAEVRHEIAAGRRGDVPGAVRMSMGLGSTRQDVDALIDALLRIEHDGPRWSYSLDEHTGEYVPQSDGRARPSLPFPLAWAAPHAASGELS